MYKVNSEIAFADESQYLLMRKQLESAGLQFDVFVTYCLDQVWNQMLEEHARQQSQIGEEEELSNEIAGDESNGDIESFSESAGLDIEASSV